MLDTEIVAVSPCNFGLDEAPCMDGAVVNDTDTVDMRGLAVIAAEGETIVPFVDQHGQSAADLCVHLVKDDFLLEAHQFIDAAVCAQSEDQLPCQNHSPTPLAAR